jgi:hypothetical protein
MCCSGVISPRKGVIQMEDFLAESENADYAYQSEFGWNFWWLNTPSEGRCLCAEFLEDNSPTFSIRVMSNEEAISLISMLRANGWESWTAKDVQLALALERFQHAS